MIQNLQIRHTSIPDRKCFIGKKWQNFWHVMRIFPCTLFPNKIIKKPGKVSVDRDESKRFQFSRKNL